MYTCMHDLQHLVFVYYCKYSHIHTCISSSMLSVYNDVIDYYDLNQACNLVYILKETLNCIVSILKAHLNTCNYKHV